MIYLATDPGQLCGVAWESDTGKKGSATVELVALAQFFTDTFNTDRVVCFVEKMAGTWARSKDHRSNANAVVRAIKKQWPRKNKIHIIQPREWQAAMLRNVPGQTTKEQSLWLASRTPGFGVIKDHNRADAVNQLNYGLAVLVQQVPKGRHSHGC